MHKLTCVLPLCLMLVCLSANFAWADWHLWASGFGSVEGYAFDSSRSRIFAADRSTVLWRSTDGGTTWTGQTGLAFPDEWVHVRDVDALDARADTIIATGYNNVGYGGKLAYSFNGGDSWTQLTQSFVMPEMGNFLQVWRVRHNVWLYVGSQGRFAISEDYGATWTEHRMSNDGQKNGLYQDPLHDSTLYVFGNYDLRGDPPVSRGGVEKSTDLGLTWTPILHLDSLGLTWAYVERVSRLSNGDLVALTYITEPWWENGNVLISTNDGATWSRVYGGITDRYRPTEIAEDRLAPGTVFLSGASRYGLYWSHDYGRTWARCLNGLPENVSNTDNLRFDPFQGNVLVSVWGYGVYSTSDHGNHWTTLPIPPVRASGLLDEIGNTLCLNDWNSRQWRLDDSSMSWHEVLPPATQDTFVMMDLPTFSSADTLIVGFHKRAFGPPTDVFQIARSINGGGNWSLNPPLDFFPAFPIESQTTEFGRYFATCDFYPAQMRVSMDDGRTWTSRPIAASYYCRGWVHNESAVYAVVNDGVSYSEIYRSTDVGVSWTGLQYPGAYLFGVRTLVPLGNELYVKTEAREQSRCLHWANGQWEERGTIADTAYFIRLMSIVEQDTLLLGASTARHIWLSRDLGYTWERRDYVLPFESENQGLGEIAYDRTQHRLWASSTMGACYLEASELSASGPLHFHPTDYKLFSVSPNPFNSEARIAYELKKAVHVKLTVTDLTGRLVRVLADDVQTSGRHEILFDGKALASGTYFVKLQAGNVDRTEKMLLLK